MQNLGPVKVVGVVLRAQQPWLNLHAGTDTDGRLYCRDTGEPILSRVYHRYRLDGQAPGAAYVRDIDLPADKTASGRMVSFSSFGCTACGHSAEPPAHINASNLMVRQI